MGNKINYQTELEKKLKELSTRDKVPSLLLHSCCAPCSSYVLEYLSDFFYIKVLFYNPNLYPETEFERRKIEQQRLIQSMSFRYPVTWMEGRYQPEEFYEVVKGLEHCTEGMERCFKCYELRLEETAKIAAKEKFDFFTTTLTISPLKNADIINEIGLKIGEQYRVNYLTSDFKKKNGYKRSVELSYEYNLYRQSYCGCAYSRRTIA